MRIAVNWVTEITQVVDRRLFVDERRVEPYRFWHHQHHFWEVAGGTEASDILHYALPLGPAGELAGGALVKKRVAEIFAFRRDALFRQFGEIQPPGRPPPPGANARTAPGPA